MKSFSSFLLTLVCTLLMCTACDDGPKAGGSSDNMGPGSGNYGNLNGGIIAVGGTRDLTYTSAVILGTVDFNKIDANHSYGVVYMEAVPDENFNYNEKLEYGGKNDKNDKYTYTCYHYEVKNSVADGKFEKQLTDLKPATTYYYRGYVTIGGKYNFSRVEKFTTKDPQPEITMATAEASDIRAIAATLNGGLNIGNLRDVNENQEYGFIYTLDERLNSPEKLTYEYVQDWELNHFETEDELLPIEEDTTDKNMDGRISCTPDDLIPGRTYYYRTFFSWNGKYFYSKDVKEFKTLGVEDITVGVIPVSDISTTAATLSASFPYSLVGTSGKVTVGFLFSKKYSNASEFTMENAEFWDSGSNKKADMWYVFTETSEKEYSVTLDALEPNTTYYVCGWVFLAEYKDPTTGKNVAIYSYGPVQSFTTEEKSSVSGSEEDERVTMSSEGSYPWTLNDGVWVSGNAKVHSSMSVLNIVVQHKEGQRLSFQYKVSSEKEYDKLNIYVGSQTYTYSGNDSGIFVTPQFTYSGETTIRAVYQKDESGSQGEDCAEIWNVTVLE